MKTLAEALPLAMRPSQAASPRDDDRESAGSTKDGDTFVLVVRGPAPFRHGLFEVGEPAGRAGFRLRSASLVLQPVVRADATALWRELFGAPRMMQFWENGLPYTEAYTASRVAAWESRWAHGFLSWWLILTRPDNALVGAIGFGAPDASRSLEVAYLVRQVSWNRGVATQAVSMASTFAMMQQSPERFYATVHPGNRASRRVLHKCGFAPDGSADSVYSGPRMVYELAAHPVAQHVAPVRPPLARQADGVSRHAAAA